MTSDQSVLGHLHLDDTKGLLHERIAGMLRRALGTGLVPTGGQLPPASELADHLEVNINTVLRAYRQLASEGLVEMRRGHGTIVRESPESAVLHQLAEELVSEAARLGVTRGELIAIIADRW